MHLDAAGVDLTSGALPAARRAGTYHVLAVCAGTICRWHVGQPIDPRAAYALAVQGFDGTAHRAQTLSPGLLRWADTVLAASEVADGLYEAYVSPR